jgi:hypothetical protein
MNLNISNINVAPPKGLEKVIQAYFSESDRGFLIVACTFIEEQMDEVLGKKLAGKLSTFSLKTTVISELFLGQKLTQIIIAIGKLRNKAAHSTHAFKLEAKDPNFKTNIVRKMKSHALYEKVKNIEVNLAGMPQLTKIKKLKMGEVLGLPKNMSQSRAEMMICTISIAVYLKALNENALMPLKKHKFDFN